MLKNLAGILETKDAEILSDALWAWAYLAESDTISLPALLEKFPTKNLASFLRVESQSLLVAALRFVGNVCASSDPAVTAFMTDDLLKSFSKVLSTKANTDIIKECCLIIHNYAIGPSMHAERLVSLGVFDSLCNTLVSSSDVPVKREATNSLTTVVSGSTAGNLQEMLKRDLVLKALCAALDLTCAEALAHALLALENLLSVEEIGQYNPYATEWHVVGGLEKLEGLMQYGNSVVSERARKIMDVYFYVPAKEEYQLQNKDLDKPKN